MDKFDWERVCKQNIYIFLVKIDWCMIDDCSEGVDVSLYVVIVIFNRIDFFFLVFDVYVFERFFGFCMDIMKRSIDGYEE